jgi:hypothetical protein
MTLALPAFFPAFHEAYCDPELTTRAGMVTPLMISGFVLWFVYGGWWRRP